MDAKEVVAYIRERERQRALGNGDGTNPARLDSFDEMVAIGASVEHAAADTNAAFADGGIVEVIASADSTLSSKKVHGGH